VPSKKYQKEQNLKNEIDKILEKINSSMSVYDKSSEISVFNAMGENSELPVSKEFLDVLKAGQKIYELTDGYWDATIGPLVELWGFGSEKKEFKVLDTKEVDKKLLSIGFDKIEISEGSKKIKKKQNNVFLDLGSIAKGYGVDLVSDYLKKKGYKDFMVEIGGEVYVSGKNLRNEKWKIGINRPKPGAKTNDIIDIIEISNLGIATSGTYRNFAKSGKKIYSHIINPKTGYPVKTNLVSVTVISDTCTYADGLATGMLAMGAKKALSLCEALENTECMTIEDAKGFRVNYSSGFKEFLKMK
jgi:thiamine biosynthesis lipoprotein